MKSISMSLGVMATVALALPLAGQAQSQTPVAAPSTASAPAKSAVRAAKRPAPPSQNNMDLSAPPLSHIYPRTQLQYILAVDNSDADSAEEVSVKSPKYIVPVPVGQFQAIPWALMHPIQAWRVIAPVEQP